MAVIARDTEIISAGRETVIFATADEAQAIAPRLAKLEDQLDAEFLKTAIPFKPETYAGRKAKSNRVAVVEPGTGYLACGWLGEGRCRGNT